MIDPANVDAASHSSGNVAYLSALPAVSDCNFDLVIIPVKPQVVADVLPDYALRLSRDGFVASIAAGCSLEKLRHYRSRARLP